MCVANYSIDFFDKDQWNHLYGLQFLSPQPSVDTFACQPGKLKCEDNLQCIWREWLCDGIIHCNDGSDEHECALYIPPGSDNRNVSAGKLSEVSDSVFYADVIDKMWSCVHSVLQLAALRLQCPKYRLCADYCIAVLQQSLINFNLRCSTLCCCSK